MTVDPYKEDRCTVKAL